MERRTYDMPPCGWACWDVYINSKWDFCHYLKVHCVISSPIQWLNVILQSNEDCSLAPRVFKCVCQDSRSYDNNMSCFLSLSAVHRPEEHLLPCSFTHMWGGCETVNCKKQSHCILDAQTSYLCTQKSHRSQTHQLLKEFATTIVQRESSCEEPEQFCHPDQAGQTQGLNMGSQ